MTPGEYMIADEAVTVIALYISQKMADSALPSGLYDVIAADLLPLWMKKAATVHPPGSRPTHVAALRWVIRDDDLRILDTVLDSLKVSAGAGFFVLPNIASTATIVAAAGLFTGIVKLAYNATSKGVALSPHHYSIISTLFGQRDGLTDEDLLSRLLRSQDDWTIDGVRAGLATLSEAPSRSGKIALVWKSADDRWRTTGV